MNTDENNKLIAEFMGWKYNKPNRNISTHFPNGTWADTKRLGHGTLSFHSSWDWLIPVVDKIESLEDSKYRVTIRQHLCYIGHNLGYGNWNMSDAYQTGNSKIEAAWLAVVEFIKSYNERNQNGIQKG